MPGPIFLIERFFAENPATMEFRGVPAATVRIEPLDPANLAQYGVAREHPGAPAPRPGEIPWVGKVRKGRKQ